MISDKVLTMIPKENRLETGIRLVKALVTPEMAQKWLDKNIKNNRNLSTKNMAAILADFEKGKWNGDNGETIKFDVNGKMTDGQHRLSAIVKWNKPVQTHVMFGVSLDGFVTMDTGKRRSAGDMLKIQGFSYVREIPSMIQTSEALLQGKYLLPTPMTNSEILQMALKSKKDFEHICKKACTFNHRYKPVTKAEFGAIFRVFKMIDYTEANLFLEMVSNGINLDSNHPAFVLRKVFSQELFAKSRKLSPKERMAYLILAWNAFMEGREVKKFKWSIQDTFPKPYGLGEERVIDTQENNEDDE